MIACLFPAPIITDFKYRGPELHNETQRFSLLNKENRSNSEPLSIYVISTLGPKSVLEAHQYLALNTLSLFPAKIFVTEKRETVIQNLSYNLCFVDPSFGFVSIITITPFYHISTCIISTNIGAKID